MAEQLLVGTDFSGLGSPEEALKRLNIDYSVEFACEKDKYARQSYLANHKPKIFYDDVTTRDNSKAGYVDLYVFGFPCQAFSNAGKRLGFQDTRGTLFFNSLDYINQNRPRVFIAENVKGLLSHDKKKGTKGKYGNTFNTILDCLAITANGQYNLHKYDDCVNYHVYYMVHNTKNYGIPQNRERIFIVGFRDEQDAANFRFNKGFELQLKLKDMLQDNPENCFISKEVRSEEGKAIRSANIRAGRDFNPYRSKELIFENTGIANTITTSLTKDHYVMTDGIYPVDEKYYLSDKALEYIIKDSGNWSDRLSMMNYDTADTAGCITANHAKGVPYNMLTVHVNEATKQGYAEASPGDSINLSNPKSKTRRGRVGVGVANTLDTACNQAVVTEVRQINTSKEAAGKQPYMQNRVFDTEAISPAVTSSFGDRINIVEQKLIPMFGTENNSQAHRIYSDEGLASTLSTHVNKTASYHTGIRIRRLTPRECFRLQGYSDAFFDLCAAIQSDTQLYKQAGNSITVDTIMYLLKQVLTAIKYNS